MKVYSLGSSAWTSTQAGVEHAMTFRHDIFDKLHIENQIIITSDYIQPVDDARFVSVIEHYQGQSQSMQYILDSHFDFNGLFLLKSNDKEIYLDQDGVKQYEVHHNEKGDTLIMQFSGDIQQLFTITRRGYFKSQIGNMTFYYDDSNRVKLIYDHSSMNYQLLKGSKIMLLNLTELLTEYINSTFEKNSVIFFDRNDLVEDLPARLRDDIKKVLIVHNNHLASNDIDNERQANNFYLYHLSHPEFFDKVITSTQEQADDIKKRYNIDTKCIPVGSVDKQFLEESLKFTNKDRFSKSIVIFSRIAIDKKLHELVKAFRKVIDHHPEAILSIYGFANQEVDGSKPGLELLQNAIADNNLKESVLVNDYVSDKSRIYQIERKAQLYILGSTMEGFNLGLMEGLASGLIGVSTDVKYGPNELIKNNITGYIVDYDDYDSLSDKIIKLFDHPDLIESMRKSSIKHLIENYSTEVISLKWKDLIVSFGSEQND